MQGRLDRLYLARLCANRHLVRAQRRHPDRLIPRWTLALRRALPHDALDAPPTFRCVHGGARLGLLRPPASVRLDGVKRRTERNVLLALIAGLFVAWLAALLYVVTWERSPEPEQFYPLSGHGERSVSVVPFQGDFPPGTCPCPGTSR
jgi:hypothetical protein